MAESVKVLELFSGIGGMRFALQMALSEKKFSFLAADINPSANTVYAHNFSESSNRNICGLNAENLTDFEVLTMSPPCQPFSRNGLRKGTDDSRSEPLLHVIHRIIPYMNSLKYVLVENVQGFEVSDTRIALIDNLSKYGFKFREFLLCPTNFGIPNSRLRYYLIAIKSFNDFNFGKPGDILKKIPVNSEFKTRKLADYIRNQEDYSELFLPDKVLVKYGKVLDIVTPNSDRCCCFTKNYGRYVEGTGSVLCTTENIVGGNETKPQEKQTEKLKDMRLRYFSPEEISDLLGFPENFSFPDSLSRLSRYKLLGNSLNVIIVSNLLNLLFDHQKNIFPD